VYAELLPQLAAASAEWVQFDEPILVTDPRRPHWPALSRAYERLAAVAGRVETTVATYFDVLGIAVRPSVDGIAVDLTGPSANP
jgi:5-methyltetrahydropteroyltriglutamate--homocysteine methyltransferase